MTPYVQTNEPLNHKKTVWLKMKVRSVNYNEGYVRLEGHPSLLSGWDAFECDIDDIYIEESKAQPPVAE